MEPRLQILNDWLRTACAAAHGLLVPVSGGSDSALNFALCMTAWPEKTVAVHAGLRRTLRCAEWFESIGKVLFVDTPGEPEECEEMRNARFRSMSRALDAWLVGSRNRTEDKLGTYSLVGGLPSILPLVGLWKSEVMDLCRLVGVPDEIIISSLRADPACGRPKELAEIPYRDIERFLKSKEGMDADLSPLKPGQLAYLERVYAANAFKKTLPVRGPCL